jgi:hypothetical protein
MGKICEAVRQRFLLPKRRSGPGRGEGEENSSLVRIIGEPTMPDGPTAIAGEEIPIPMMGERDEV